jgi:TfoX/Sxy family transcriptional regulator of competence genes
LDPVSPMTGGSLPRPSETVKAAFLRLVPGDPAVTTRPMFGNMAAFVNGNMFAGLFGEDLFVRLPDDDRAEVIKQGGRNFEVMPGRAMTGYVTVPATWSKKPEPARRWIARSLELTRALPPKVAAGKKAASKKAAGKK